MVKILVVYFFGRHNDEGGCGVTDQICERKIMREGVGY